jgi:DNA helicase-4
MINLAISYIDSKAFSLNYKHLFVDEFQDISVTRAHFVKSILQHQNAFLTAVGDDWQSINRFAGSDISLIQNFHPFFGDSETIKLDYTFRFNNQVSDIASSFILKNPSQLHKDIKTIKISEENKFNIFIQHVDKVKNEDGYMIYDNEPFIRKVLGLITDKHINSDERISVMILDRYKYNQPDLQKLQEGYNIDLSFYTVHGSKGLEADYVILQNMISGENGFPSKKEDDPIINLVSKNIDEYEDAEERRLFYVALTRTKHSLFISGRIILIMLVSEAYS